MKSKAFTLADLLLAIVVVVITAGIIGGVATEYQQVQQKEQEHQALQHPIANTRPTVEDQVPVISYEGRTPEKEKLDTSTVDPRNTGVMVDMDFDGVVDFVQMDGPGNTLWFTKCLANGAKLPRVPILVINGKLMAYNVYLEDVRGIKRPVVVFWDDKGNGYRQRCMGVSSSGKPFFGEIEAR